MVVVAEALVMLVVAAVAGAGGVDGCGSRKRVGTAAFETPVLATDMDGGGKVGGGVMAMIVQMKMTKVERVK